MARSLRVMRPILTVVAATAMAVGTAPAAGADPLTDLLCNLGSAQFCAPAEEPAPEPAPAPAPAPEPAPAPAPEPAPAPAPAPQDSTFEYKNCDAARAAGAAPVHRGDYGYGRHLDRDNDGVGCERA